MQCLENDFYSKVCEDEFADKLNIYNDEEEDDDNFNYSSPFYNDLDDLSI